VPLHCWRNNVRFCSFNVADQCRQPKLCCRRLIDTASQQIKQADLPEPLFFPNNTNNSLIRRNRALMLCSTRAVTWLRRTIYQDYL